MCVNKGEAYLRFAHEPGGEVNGVADPRHLAAALVAYGPEEDLAGGDADVAGYSVVREVLLDSERASAGGDGVGLAPREDNDRDRALVVGKELAEGSPEELGWGVEGEEGVVEAVEVGLRVGGVQFVGVDGDEHDGTEVVAGDAGPHGG